ncbi:MAG TPA: TetR family transcriptional regulator [Clostridiales bacterium]|nr:TetR family transcriptional regulator [Clostridiales bacterium]
MAQKAEYRSAKRSKILIKKAFAELLREKKIDKITVTDIIERAGISRGTFYAHYSDVYGLLNVILNEELNLFSEYLIANGVMEIVREPEFVFTTLMAYIDRDFEYYKALFLAKDNVLFLRELQERLINVFNDEDYKKNHAGETNEQISEVKLYVIFYTTAIATVLTNWLNGTIEVSPERLNQILSDIIRNTVGHIYEDEGEKDKKKEEEK